MFEKLEELAKNNKKISDFHIRSGSPLGYRQTGEIIKVKEVMIKPQDLQDLMSTNCNEVEIKRFKETHELDSSVTLSGLRFRANFYKTINGPAAVLRRDLCRHFFSYWRCTPADSRIYNGFHRVFMLSS